MSLWLILNGNAFAAIYCFAAAVATDFLDGYVARLRGEASRFGGFFDHLTDALFVAAGLGALGLLGRMPIILAPLILLAFLQYAVDSRILMGRPLRASQLGRINGIAYYVLLGGGLFFEALELNGPGGDALRLLGWLLVISTLLSILDRAVAWWVSRRVRGSPDAGR